MIEPVASTEHAIPGTLFLRLEPGCTIYCVSTESEFDAIEGDWNKLLEHAHVSVFQTFEWHRTWWKYKSTPQDGLHILLFVVNSQIIGIAPLCRRNIGPAMPCIRKLEFIACGLSDYADFIIQKGAESLIASSFASYLRASASQWDVCDLEDINESSPLLHYLPAALENQGMSTFQYQGNVCPHISLPTSSEILMKGLGPTTSYNFKRKFKRLQQNFTPEVKVYRHETDNIEQAIEEFSAVHGGRWKSQGYPSAFDDPSHRAFHVEVSRKFARRGWLRMYFLLANGAPVALSYGFNFRDRIYMYHSNAHGSEEIMRCSPGFLIRSIAMVEGIDEGMKVFDYLRGDEPYKYREYQAVDSKNYLLRVSSPARLGSMRFAAYLLYELSQKGISRSRRELYEYRRFKISGQRSRSERVRYFGKRLGELGILANNFIMRHAPLQSMRKLQIERSIATDRSITQHSAPSKELHDHKQKSVSQ